MDEMRKDRQELRRLCERYRQKVLSDDKFVANVKSIVRPWDAFGRSLLLGQVEATVNRHFCELWDECRYGCQWPDQSKWKEEVAKAFPKL